MVRVKSRWFRRNKPKSAEDIGTAMAYLSWRTAYNAVQRMLVANYELATDERRFGIMAELLAFLLQASDRYAHQHLDDEQRARCINSMAGRLAATMEDNQRDRLGNGDYRTPFVELLNQRLEVYSGFSFNAEVPGFAAIRFLGDRVEALMEGEEARWMREQIMEVEAPEAIGIIRRGWKGFFDIETQ